MDIQSEIDNHAQLFKSSSDKPEVSSRAVCGLGTLGELNSIFICELLDRATDAAKTSAGEITHIHTALDEE